MLDRLSPRIRAVVLATAVAAFGAAPALLTPALAAWPDHPIRLIVDFDAGTSADLGARQLTPKLSELLGQNVIVENHGGAGGIIGNQQVATASPDGYTLLFDSAQHTVNISLYKKLPFDPIKDFTAIGLVDTQYFVLVVPSTLPVKSVADLTAYGKARPGQLNFASTGNGTTAHLGGALYGNMAGLQLVHVPYKSAGQALVDLAGNQVQMMVYTYIALKPMIDSGKLRVLATTGPTRLPTLPDAPTMQESGFKDYTMSTWHGFYGPAKMPADIVNKINAALVETVKDPKVVADMKQAGVEPAPDTPAEFAAFNQSEMERYKKVVAISGAKID